ncbi:uncharacterized protein B0H18DRAFT_839941, partial [Fomitopsis serialis]|uniref:uncharacterized protein n=1 Tax=Fomitopsis serialis TaxID=139415 RepID=UPI002007B29C
WLRGYLKLDGDRPTWAYAADVLLSIHVTADAGEIRPSAQINTFLQTWKPATHGKTGLPRYLTTMLRIGKKYNVSLAAIKLDRNLKGKLPIWYHMGASKKLRRLNNTSISDCLRETHGILRVVDLLRLTRRQHTRGDAPNPNANPSECICDDCIDDMAQGCLHPHKCIAAAANLLEQVAAKWHPHTATPGDGLSHTRTRRIDNIKAHGAGQPVCFDPSITERGDLSEAFRVFVHPDTHDRPPALRTRRGRVVQDETTSAYVADAYTLKGNRSLRERDTPASGGVHLSGLELRTMVATAPADMEGRTDRTGELAATTLAVTTVPLDVPLRIVS